MTNGRFPRGAAGRGKTGDARRPSQPPRGPESVATVTVSAIAAGGDGIGRAGELAVFIPRTAPGDVVQVAFRQQGRLGRGRVLQVLTPSPLRVDATCSHYEADRCGGCQLQHVEATAQRAARQQIVQDALRRIGKRDVPLPSITADVQWGYRSRLTLTLRRRGRGWVGGLHAHDDATRVFALTECPIAHPALVAGWTAVQQVMRSHALPDTPELRLSLRREQDAAGEGMAVVVQGGRDWPGSEAFGRAAGAIMMDGPAISAVWWLDDGGHATACWSRSETLAPSPAADDPREDAATADYVPDTGEALAFAQVNETVATALRERVFAHVMHAAPQRVVDAYAGVGTLTDRLARDGVQAIAIEADAAGANAALARLAVHDVSIRRRARVICDVVERALPALPEAEVPDVVVLNPPRRGVDARVTAWLESAPARVQRLVYVSCNPATLARDVARLASWQIDSVECFDMFPQTAHVETVCVLQRSQGRETA